MTVPAVTAARAAEEARQALASIRSGTEHVARYDDRGLTNVDLADLSEDIREMRGWVPRDIATIDAALARLVEQAEAVASSPDVAGAGRVVPVQTRRPPGSGAGSRPAPGGLDALAEAVRAGMRTPVVALTPESDHNKPIHDALASLDLLVEQAEQAGRERDEAVTRCEQAEMWFENNFVDEDGDPVGLSLVQMFEHVRTWGDKAWGAAGQQAQLFDDARQRLEHAEDIVAALLALAEAKGLVGLVADEDFSVILDARRLVAAAGVPAGGTA